MDQSNQSMKHLLRTLERYVDRESTHWMPLVPVDSQIECFNQRSEIVEWLITLNHKFDFCDETLFLTVDIFDRFLRRIRAATKYLRCIGITCLYLAAKVNEEDEMIPITSELIEQSQCGCSEAEVLRMERCILTKLDWTLFASPTSLQFIHLFEALVRTKCPTSLTNDHRSNGTASSSTGSKRSTMTRALILCLPQLDLVQHSPSTVALSLLSLHLQITWQYWLPAINTLQPFTLVTDVKLAQCMKLMERHVGAFLIESLLDSSCSAQCNSNSNIWESPNLVLPTSHEEKLMENLSVANSNKVPYKPASNPVTPDPPAKRRRIEMDDEVYSDIRSLYEPPAKPLYVPRFPRVTPLMTYAAVVRSSCASQALHHGAALTMPFQRVASI